MTQQGQTKELENITTTTNRTLKPKKRKILIIIKLQ